MVSIDLLSKDISELSGDDYEQVVTLLERSPEALRAQGQIAVSPSIVLRASLRMRRGELGSGPRNVVEVLGLHELVTGHVVCNLKPYCATCQCEAAPPSTLDMFQLPDHGVLAVAVVDGESNRSLKERAELLGVERAYVDGLLVAVSQLTEEEGEPVLSAVAASDIPALQSVIEHWFTRFGGDLRLLHFSSRIAAGHDIGMLRGSWSCSLCNREFSQISRRALQEAANCDRCAGDGWLLAPDRLEGQRWIECSECEALGFSGEFKRYRFFGVPLSRVLMMPFSWLRGVLQSHEQNQDILPLLDVVCGVGLGELPLGAIYELCSPGERILISLAQLRFAWIQGARCLVDGAYIDQDICSPATREPGVVVVGVQSTELRPWVFAASAESSRIVLRDINHGVLRLAEVTFPQGALTAVSGPLGVGKSLLLQIIAKRFAKKRLCSHSSSFGALRRCALGDASETETTTLLDLVCFGEEVAEEISRTRRAQELGIIREDLGLLRGKYSCEQCRGESLYTCDRVCSVCQGIRYDWRVSQLPLFGRTVSEVLRAPIAEAANFTWTGPGSEAVLQAVAPLVAEGVSLSTPALCLSPVLRRLIKLVAFLTRVQHSGKRDLGRGGSAGDLSTHLVLLDGPRVMPGQHQEIIGGLLEGLLQQGATVVYASMPQQLESCCQSVIRLGWKRDAASTFEREQFLDTRFGRSSCVM